MQGKRKRTVRKWIGLFVALSAVALIAEGILLTGIFSKEKPKKQPAVTKEPDNVVITDPTLEITPGDREVRVWRPLTSTISDEESYPLFTMVYDDAGNVLEKVTFLTGGGILERALYSYNAEDRLIQTETYTRDYENGGLYDDPSVQTRTYDDNGNLIRVEVKSREWDLSTRTDYTYDEDHHLLTETHFQAVPIYSSSGYGKATRTVYEYDAAGNRTKEARIAGHYHEFGDRAWEFEEDPAGQYEWECTFSYDTSGNCLSEDGHDCEADEYTKVTRTFDEKGHKLSEVREYSASGEWYGEMSFRYEYDASGNLVAEYLNSRPNDASILYTHKTEYTYGEKGRKIREKEIYRDGTLLSDTEYRYDEYGMVSEEIRYDQNGEVNSIRTNRYQEFLLPPDKLTEEELAWLARETA